MRKSCLPARVTLPAEPSCLAPRNNRAGSYKRLVESFKDFSEKLARPGLLGGGMFYPRPHKQGLSIWKCKKLLSLTFDISVRASHFYRTHSREAGFCFQKHIQSGRPLCKEQAESSSIDVFRQEKKILHKGVKSTDLLSAWHVSVDHNNILEPNLCVALDHDTRRCIKPCTLHPCRIFVASVTTFYTAFQSIFYFLRQMQSALAL